MSSLKPIKLWGHAGGPNPWKVAIFLEELGIPYHHELIELSKSHEKPFVDVNPNGRVPAIEDPNTGLTLWESGAILEYLQETYDKENKFAGEGLDKFLIKQWLHFQVSGQGPYFGQAIWFKRYHPERIQSAVERYQKEALRVVGVLNKHLQGKTYLVGEKYTIADLAFVPWDLGLPNILEGGPEVDFEKEYPAYFAWNARVLERPAVKKALADRMEAMSKH